MDFNNIDINFNIISFFINKKYDTLDDANDDIQHLTGIVNFFNNDSEIRQLYATLWKINQKITIPKNIEFGDYQTNLKLTDSVCALIKKKNIEPKILIEPTCGVGNFVISALYSFNSLKYIYAIEIQPTNIWQLKFALIEFFINNPENNKPDIFIFNYNFFKFNFSNILELYKQHELLILGNPPWVTNSELSAIDSDNLPQKSNFKKLKGIDAITGKSNFDIAEFITYKLIDTFSSTNGTMTFLLKNSVIKNILINQKLTNFSVGSMEQHKINAQKEFKVAADASLFICNLNTIPEFTINEYDFYTSKQFANYGWVNNKFVSDISNYKIVSQFDGICPFEWRQGVKHDCSKIMELEQCPEGYINGLSEIFEPEDDLIYGILKSSDLKGDNINSSRKYTIITQTKVGQETQHVLDKLPKTKEYLYNNINYLNNRKSNVYKSKPLFSIFGVGDYSFKPYKVAISGLYKQTKFTLIEPSNEKCLMLDDTCYFIGFDNYEEAIITQYLLNSNEIQQLLKSLIFMDSKRVITKELLMRIDLNSYIKYLIYSNLKFNVSRERIVSYLNKLNNIPIQTLNIN